MPTTILPDSNGETLTTVVPESDEEPVRVSTDSGYNEEDSMLSTVSIPSNSDEFEKENGRTYHGYKSEKKFLLPNDEQERERLNSKVDLIHALSFVAEAQASPSS